MYYHEAGHAVTLHWYRFRPTEIDRDITYFDSRTTWFLRNHEFDLYTFSARERAQDLAVCAIAGIVAESRIAGVPLESLRGTTGEIDYSLVHAVAIGLLDWQCLQFTSDLIDAHTHLWERRALAVFDRLWRPTVSVAEELHRNRGILKRKQLHAAIDAALRLTHGY